MNIKKESKITIETTACFSKGILKTHNCDLGDWWGEDICEQVDFNKVITEMGVPTGEYKISITMERIDD